MAIPGIAAGRTCFQIVCHWVAPSAIEPSRIEGGTARIASRPAMITTGSTSSAEREAAGQHHAAELEGPANEEGEPEDPVDDRGDRGEVLDVDLDEPVPPALPVGVLLEVDRGRDPDRDDEQRCTPAISQSVPKSAGRIPRVAG